VTKTRNSLLRHMLRDAQPAIESIVKCEKQTLASISLNVVKQLSYRPTLSKLTQAGRNIR